MLDLPHATSELTCFMPPHDLPKGFSANQKRLWNPLENQKHRLCFAGISQAADQVQEGADELAQDAQEVVDDLEETFESAADAAAQQLATTADQFQSAAQGAADSASNFVDSLQSRQLLNQSTLKAAALIPESNTLVSLALVHDLPHDLTLVRDLPHDLALLHVLPHNLALVHELPHDLADPSGLGGVAHCA